MEIDRSESIRTTYVYDHGRLREVENVHEAPRWSEEYAAKLAAQLEPKLAAGGSFLGAFEGDELAGVAVLGGEFIGEIASSWRLRSSTSASRIAAKESRSA